MGILKLVLLLAGLRLGGWMICRRAFPGSPAAAYAVAGGLGLLVAAQATALLAWLLELELAGRSLGFGLAVLLVAALAARLLPGARAAWPRASEVFGYHAVWALAFGCALWLTAHNPSVDPDSERFMDLAMLRAYADDAAVPSEDPWYAGHPIAYYDGGYYLGAWLARASGADISYLFNLLVAGVYASLAAGVYGVVAGLAGWRAGAAAAFLVALSGPPDALRQLVVSGQVDWFQTARVLPDTITEFPYFSLLWGDLHPYFMALSVWPVFLLFVLGILREPAGAARWPALLVASLTLGALIWIHTWDLLALAAGFLLALALGLVRGRLSLGAAARGLATVAGAALVVALPFLGRLPRGAGGLARVSEPSPIGTWLLLFGGFILLLAAAGSTRVAPSRSAPIVLFAVAAVFAVLGFSGLPVALSALAACLSLALDAGEPRPEAWALAAVAFGLLAAIELYYVDDFYGPPLERMNTVFKVVMHAWVLLGTACGLLVPAITARSRGRGARLAVLAACVALGSVYPVWATPARLRYATDGLSLDSERAFAREHPGDWQAARALRERLSRGRLAEWAGEPYTWSGRFASFTGWPAVVGWAHHEAGWRGDWEGPLGRMRLVQELYTTLDAARARELLTRLRVDFVVVGALERQNASEPALAKFASLGTLVVEAGGTRVYRVSSGVERP